MDRPDRDETLTDRAERDRREMELCADLHERIARARELTRRSRDLLSALAAEPRSFRRDD